MLEKLRGPHNQNFSRLVHSLLYLLTYRSFVAVLFFLVEIIEMLIDLLSDTKETNSMESPDDEKDPYAKVKYYIKVAGIVLGIVLTVGAIFYIFASGSSDDDSSPPKKEPEPVVKVAAVESSSLPKNNFPDLDPILVNEKARCDFFHDFIVFNLSDEELLRILTLDEQLKVNCQTFNILTTSDLVKIKDSFFDDLISKNPPNFNEQIREAFAASSSKDIYSKGEPVNFGDLVKQMETTARQHRKQD